MYIYIYIYMYFAVVGGAIYEIFALAFMQEHQDFILV